MEDVSTLLTLVVATAKDCNIKDKGFPVYLKLRPNGSHGATRTDDDNVYLKVARSGFLSDDTFQLCPITVPP